MTKPHQNAVGDVEPLPDLLGLSLAELRRLDHPVLSAVLDELWVRVLRPGETLWDFQMNAGSGDEAAQSADP